MIVDVMDGRPNSEYVNRLNSNTCMSMLASAQALV